jgi:hypothetical protein
MSKSWRQPPPEGRLPQKYQHEPTLLEELYEMERERYLVMAAWAPLDVDFELEEVVSLNRTQHGAWVVLKDIAEGQDYDLKPGEGSFTADGDEHTEYFTWYISTIIEGD